MVVGFTTHPPQHHHHSSTHPPPLTLSCPLLLLLSLSLSPSSFQPPLNSTIYLPPNCLPAIHHQFLPSTMSSDAVTVVQTDHKPQRRFPPPCWTQQETLALIQAYRDRWYALRRGYLRTADWESVAATVAATCPAASAPKTSAQCRHKMEKLRQRFRAEKQRAASFPNPGGRFFSSWFFFDNMEAMENGTNLPKPEPENSDETRVNHFPDQNIVKLKLKSKNNAEFDPDLGFDNAKRFNPSTQIRINYSEIPDQIQENKSQPPFKSRAKTSTKTFNNFNINDGFNHQLFQTPLRIRKMEPNTAPIIKNRHDPNPEEDFWARAAINHNKFGTNSNPIGGGSKRRRSSLEEMVESIKMLGEGLVRMENAKMEMAREIEAARMEMEMKRNEMLLESQKQIVDAFLKGLFELKSNKKIKTVAQEDSAAQ